MEKSVLRTVCVCVCVCVSMFSHTDEFKLIGPSDREQYNRSAVTLSCRLSPEISAVDLEIRWLKRTDCVCVYKNSKVTEGRGYEGRVSLFTQELERGNVSLQLRDCTESDDGYYLCQVTDGDRTEEITVYMYSAEQRRICVEQRDTEWTEDERKKMEKSVLLTELRNKDQKISELENLEEKPKQLQEQTDPESSAPIRKKKSQEFLPPLMSEETQEPAAPIRRNSK
ncbi:butyrophilin subfamily 1 member A1-like isoform X2 [Tachysurus fulvidraco]|nr:butyrophilin subfamily 1 member A1-like isoform X2 [Tachysurus fulvidraco]